LQAVASAVAAGKTRFAPDQGWDYCNTGYVLVRQAIERVTCGSLAAAMTTHVLGPLGLGRTWVVETMDDARDAVPGYDAGQDMRFDYDPRWVGHGLLASTVHDVAAFYEALFDGRLVAPESLRETRDLVRVPVLFPPFVDPSYGLGVTADPAFPGGACFGHGGSGPGYSLEALHWPAWRGESMTIVAFFNATDVQAFKALTQLMPA
jgi:D-alanyl-D-alanine carboxypeptidase